MEIAHLESVFRDCLESCSNSEKYFWWKTLSENQIDIEINFSHKRHDGFAKSLKQSKTILNYHTSCYITYTSKSKIEKYLKAKGKQKRTNGRTQKKTTWKRVSKNTYLDLYVIVWNPVQNCKNLYGCIHPI